MKALKYIYSFVLIALAMVTFTSVAQGHDFDLKEFFQGDSIIHTMAVSPVIQMNAYSGKYQKKLFTTLFNDMEIWGDITTHTGIKSKLNMTKLDIGDGARPYAGQEQAAGNALQYTGLVLEVELGQRDYQIEIKRYYESHLEEELKKSEGSGAKQKTLPFAVQTTNMITEKLAAEMNDKTAYFGFNKDDAVVFSAGATYADGNDDYVTFLTGTINDYYLCIDDTLAAESPATHPAKWQKVNAEAICPGFRYHLDALITATKVTPINIGAIDNLAVFAYASHLKIFRSHLTAYKKSGVVNHCSYTDFELLLDDIEQQVSKYTEKDSNWTADGRGIYLPKTNKKCIVKACSWLGDSRRIISTPKDNLHGGTDRLNDMNEIKTRDLDNYNTISSITFTLGFTFQDEKAMRVNDQS